MCHAWGGGRGLLSSSVASVITSLLSAVCLVVEAHIRLCIHCAGSTLSLCLPTSTENEASDMAGGLCVKLVAGCVSVCISVSGLHVTSAVVFSWLTYHCGHYAHHRVTATAETYRKHVSLCASAVSFDCIPRLTNVVISRRTWLLRVPLSSLRGWLYMILGSSKQTVLGSLWWLKQLK